MPTAGIVAGCAQAMQLARARLHPILAPLYDLPKIQLGQHVDDVTIRMEGTANQILTTMPNVLPRFKQAVETNLTRLSPGKSKIVSSRYHLAKVLTSRLKEK